MALKPFHLQSFILLVLIAQVITHAKRHIPNNQNPSPFDFIKQLQGCHKGNKTKGLHNLKHYLQQFGYLDPNLTHTNNDNFDDALESALKIYQKNYHITPTGIVDLPTISKMTSSRCGVPDILNGVNTMEKRNHHDPHSKSFHTVSHYSFFPGYPRWPRSKTHLTYKFSSTTPAVARGPVARAFQKWAQYSHFSFSEVASNANSDLSIGFFQGDHGDMDPFDGRGGTIAHAFAPPIGMFHYDADENYAVGAVPDAFDWETVALHEIGHLLGLGHSQVEGAIMYSRIAPGRIKGIHSDDVQGIKALYNI